MQKSCYALKKSHSVRLRAFLIVTAKEHGLPPVVADPFAFLTLRVPAFAIAAHNASLEVLKNRQTKKNYIKKNRYINPQIVRRSYIYIFIIDFMVHCIHISMM